MNRAVFALLAILFLLSVSSITGLIHLAKADSSPIYINADGSINPSTAPIYSADNITYTFTGNIVNESIVVQRDNIVLDGAGFTVQGDERTGKGIDISNRNNVTVKNTNTENFDYGIYLNSSSNYNIVSNNNITLNNGGIYLNSSSSNTFSGNNIKLNNGDGIYLNSSSNNTFSDNNMTSNNGYGIHLNSSFNNTVSGNSITNIGEGILLDSSSSYNTVSGNDIIANTYDGIDIYSSSNYNTFSGNNIENNWVGVWLVSSSSDTFLGNNITSNREFGIRLDSSSGSIIYNNNFIANFEQVRNYGSGNLWDNGYPSGGNYWSDYKGTDANGDGIGDTPYFSGYGPEAITDNYPLMAPYSIFDVGTWSGTAYSVGVMSNSTVSEFKVDVAQKTVSFNVTGAEGSTGFCRVTIPNIIVQNLWQGSYTVLVDGKPCPFTNWTAEPNTYVYCNYTLSQHQIVIIPEFPSFLILPLMIMATLLAVIIYKKKGVKTSRS